MQSQVRFKYQFSPISFFLGNNPDGELWFLYVLFVFSTFTALFVAKKHLIAWGIIGAIISVFAPLIPSEIAYPSISLSFSLYQFGFFMIGLLVGNYAEHKIFDNKKWAVLGLGCYAVYGILYITNCSVWGIKAVAALGAVIAIIMLAKMIDQTESLISKCLSYLGNHSMEIFILHAPVLVCLRIILRKLSLFNLPVYIITLVLVAVVLSCIGATIINRIPALRLVLFGKEK